MADWRPERAGDGLNDQEESLPAEAAAGVKGIRLEVAEPLALGGPMNELVPRDSSPAAVREARAEGERVTETVFSAEVERPLKRDTQAPMAPTVRDEPDGDKGCTVDREMRAPGQGSTLKQFAHDTQNSMPETPVESGPVEPARTATIEREGVQTGSPEVEISQPESRYLPWSGADRGADAGWPALRPGSEDLRPVAFAIQRTERPQQDPEAVDSARRENAAVEMLVEADRRTWPDPGALEGWPRPQPAMTVTASTPVRQPGGQTPQPTQEPASVELPLREARSAPGEKERADRVTASATAKETEAAVPAAVAGASSPAGPGATDGPPTLLARPAMHVNGSEVPQAAGASMEPVRIADAVPMVDELVEARGAVREFRMTVEASPGKLVSLRFMENAGAVRVVARGGDSAVAETLRSDLRALRAQGFEDVREVMGAASELVRRATVELESRPAGAQDNPNGFGRGQAQGEDDAREQRGRNLARWFKAIDEEGRGAPEARGGNKG